MKDKLIELLFHDAVCSTGDTGECDSCKYNYADEPCFHRMIECLADYMLSQGVMVFPVKPGDTVYIINHGKIKEWKVYFVGINSQGNIKFMVVDERYEDTFEFWDYNIGVCVFLTEEDAINELKERKSYE